MDIYLTDPVAFTIAGRDIRWYGIFVCLGVAAGYAVIHWRFRRTGLPARAVEYIFYAGLICGIVGARATYYFTYMRPAGFPIGDIIKVWEGGLVSYGGFIGGAIGVIGACLVMKLDTWKVADAMAIALPLGQAFGRIGCLLNKCCYGAYGTGICTVTYPGEVGQRIPSQLYQSLINLAIFGVVLFIATRLKPRKTGLLMGITLVLYGIGRFLNEYGRTDYADMGWRGALTPAQQVAIGLFTLGLGIFIYRAKAKGSTYDDPAPDAATDGDPADTDADTPATSGKSKRRKKRA